MCNERHDDLIAHFWGHKVSYFLVRCKPQFEWRGQYVTIVSWFETFWLLLKVLRTNSDHEMTNKKADQIAKKKPRKRNKGIFFEEISVTLSSLLVELRGT